MTTKQLINFNQRFNRDFLKTENFDKLKRKLANSLNKDNLLKWSKRKVNLYISYNEINDYIAYLFDVFDSWLKANERYNETFWFLLNKLIYSLDLNKYFNQKEWNYIEHTLNIIFCKKRQLKSMVVDFSLLKSENVFFKFDINKLTLKYDNSEKKCPFNNSILYLSNKRIVIASNYDYLSISFSKNISVMIKNNNLNIVFDKYELNIETFDLYLILASIERIGILTKELF